MDRAERRYRRHLKIRWRQRLFFTAAGYDWDRDNYWWTEDGRLAKNNTRCECLGCRYGRWDKYTPDSLRSFELGGYDRYLSKFNRHFRAHDPHPLLRRGPKSGTTIWKGKL
jgi:hypothetical protein